MDEIKRAALEMAVKSCASHNPDLIVKSAEAFEAFLGGRHAASDAASSEPETVLNLALHRPNGETANLEVMRGALSHLRQVSQDQMAAAIVMAVQSLLGGGDR